MSPNPHTDRLADPELVALAGTLRCFGLKNGVMK